MPLAPRAASLGRVPLGVPLFPRLLHLGIGLLGCGPRYLRANPEACQYCVHPFVAVLDSPLFFDPSSRLLVGVKLPTSRALDQLLLLVLREPALIARSPVTWHPRKHLLKTTFPVPREPAR